MSRASSISATDLVFNILIAVTIMLIMVLLILKTKDSDPAVENRNRVVIETEWDDISGDDVDTWIMDPAGNRVGYANKSSNGMLLQRDDTGRTMDVVVDTEGNVSQILKNREVLNIRKLIHGVYTVNVVMYRRKGDYAGPVTVRSKMIRVTPFRQYLAKDVVLSTDCQQLTIISFEVFENDRIRPMPVTPVDMSLPCSGNIAP